MRVAVDSTSLLVEPTGVGTFVRGLTDGLARRRDLETVGYALSLRNGKKLREELPRSIDVGKSYLAAGVAMGMWRRLKFPAISTVTGKVDLVHATNFVAPPIVQPTLVTVHDLTPVRFPEMCSGVTLSFPSHIRRAASSDAHFHVPSAFVASELRAEFGVSPDRVHTIAHGLSELPVTTDDDARWVSEITSGAPYILSVGTIEPRKDFPTLVRAFDEISNEFPDLRLVLAGAPGWGSENLANAVADSKSSERILHLGYVDHHSRAALLASATVFAYPSIYEGFGFPPLEAMLAGIPVVATRAGAVPEVCGDAAEYADARDVGSLAMSLSRVLSDDSRRAELVVKGKEQTGFYNWTKSVDDFVNLYGVLAEPK